ncbi:MAG: large-conductance mechanosensitive channel protein MscL [Planctomycetota bacterium]
MSLISEFKDFAMKGNVVDMAVGVVIGGAFGKIVTSFVSNIIMPPLSLITAKYGLNFDELALKISTEGPKLGEDGKPMLEDGEIVTVVGDYPILKYGALLTTVLDFLLIAIAIFMAIKLMNRVKEQFEKQQEEEKKATPPSDEVVLLREIRDALNK